MGRLKAVCYNLRMGANKDNKAVMQAPLRIVETFLSVQGEGVRAGQLSQFIRLAGCNLTCYGFKVGYKIKNKDGRYITKHGCDSYFAVDPYFKNQWREVSLQQLKTQLTHGTSNHVLDIEPDIVITGGEPLIWQKYESFTELLEYFKTREAFVTIETNGTRMPQRDVFEQWAAQNLIFAISPKLSNSGMKANEAIKVDIIRDILERFAGSFLKFVINPQTNYHKDLLEILKIMHEANVPAKDVWLMPAAENRELLRRNAQSVAEIAIAQGFNYSDRVHIRLWDSARGV